MNEKMNLILCKSKLTKIPDKPVSHKHLSKTKISFVPKTSWPKNIICRQRVSDMNTLVDS